MFSDAGPRWLGETYDVPSVRCNTWLALLRAIMRRVADGTQIFELRRIGVWPDRERAARVEYGPVLCIHIEDVVPA